MEIVVRGRHLDLSAHFRELVTEKLERVDRFGANLTRIDVEVSKESNPRLSDRAFEVELTCIGAGPVVRAEACAPDKMSALDLAMGRLEERLRRAADKRRFHRHGRATTKLGSVPNDGLLEGIEPPSPPSPNGHSRPLDDETPADPVIPDDEVYAEGPVVVREKVHAAAPMSVAAAVDSMELVGHDFFLFVDADCGRPSVVYRRRAFDYGLIRLDAAIDAGIESILADGPVPVATFSSPNRHL